MSAKIALFQDGEINFSHQNQKLSSTFLRKGGIVLLAFFMGYFMPIKGEEKKFPQPLRAEEIQSHHEQYFFNVTM